MDVWEIALIGVALAMDACAVAMTDGMTDNKMPVWRVLLVGVFFGVFQFLMPIIGYYITGVIADAFLGTFEKIAAWISVVLLAFLGGKMLFECIAEKIKEKREKQETAGACTGSSCSVCQPYRCRLSPKAWRSARGARRCLSASLLSDFLSARCISARRWAISSRIKRELSAVSCFWV